MASIILLLFMQYKISYIYSMTEIYNTTNNINGINIIMRIVTVGHWYIKLGIGDALKWLIGDPKSVQFHRYNTRIFVM